MSEQYAPDEPASFDAIVERQPYEPATESADPFVGKDGLADAADEVTQGREAARELPRRFVVDPDDTSKPAPADVTMTAKTAANSVAAARAQEASWEQAEIDAATSKAIDDERGWKLYEQQPPTSELGQTQPQAPEVQAEYVAEPDELDRLLNSVPDENTRRHIKQGLIQEYSKQQAQIEQARQAAVAHAEQARAAFEQQTVSAILTAEAAALAPFPELQGVPREQVQAVLGHIARTNPQRHAEIRHHVAAVKELAANQLQTAQSMLQQRQMQVAQEQQASQTQQAQYQENFKAWASAQDDLLEKTSWANESPQNRSAIAHEIIDHYKQYGVNEQDLLDNYNKNPAMRHAATQSLIADGIRYRQAQKAAHRAQARPVPSVQKPGAATEESRSNSAYSDLERQHRGQPLTPRQAAELVIAKRARR